MILGLTGEKLAGKDTVAEYLVEKYGAENIRHSYFLDEILKILDLPVSRRNEIDLGMSIRRAFGDSILANALAKKVRESKSSLIVINGIRFQDELINAKNLGAKIIYITAPEEMRFKRFLNRKEKADDASQNLTEFRLQEHEPTEVGIPSLGVQADIKLENLGSLNELQEKVDKIIQDLK